MRARGTPCQNCRGAGSCSSCQETRDPACGACEGTGKCFSCSWSHVSWRDGPLSLRLVLSVIPTFFLYQVFVKHELVHRGRGGPVLFRPTECLLVVAFCLLYLYMVCKDFRVSEVDLRRGPISLFDDHQPKTGTVPKTVTGAADR